MRWHTFFEFEQMFDIQSRAANSETLAFMLSGLKRRFALLADLAVGLKAVDKGERSIGHSVCRVFDLRYNDAKQVNT